MNDPYWTDHQLLKLKSDLQEMLSGGLPSDGELAEYASTYAFDSTVLIRLLHKMWYRAPPHEAAWHETFDDYLREVNLKPWLEHEALKLGTNNQRERHAAGFLPQEELLALARESLFSTLADLPRWKSLGYAVVHHKGECRARVDIMSTPAKILSDTGMDHDTWDRLQVISDAVALIADRHPWLEKTKTKPSIAIYDHVATCGACHVVVKKLSAKVTIPWAGRNLVREYAL